MKAGTRTDMAVKTDRLLCYNNRDGALIDVLRKGPKNHLTVYKVRGSKIALRKEESNLILVK